MEYITYAFVALFGVVIVVLTIVYGLAYAPLPNGRPRYDPNKVLLSASDEEKLLRTNVPLNRIQSIGVHNGCHRANMIASFVPEWNYTHVPFVDQLKIGLRHLELDVWFDRRSQCWRVFHEFIDPLTNGCPATFRECLERIRDWSLRVKGGKHLPLYLYVDVKGAYWGSPFNMCAMLCGREGGCCPGTWGNFDNKMHDITAVSPEYVSMESEILAAFNGDYGSIFKPSDLVEGGGDEDESCKSSEIPHASVRDALKANGWPTVGKLSGKVFFVLNTTFGRRGVYHQLAGTKRFGRRLMWLRSEGRVDDGASFSEIDRPRDDSVFFETFDPFRAAEYARRGYIVRCLYTNRNINPEHRQHVKRMIDAGAQYFACDDLNFVSRVNVGGSKTPSTFRVVSD